MNNCKIEGCQNAPNVSFCHDHWRLLPPVFRGRYLRATNYGRKEPNEELIKEANAEIQTGEKK